MGDALVRFSIEVFGEEQVNRELMRFHDRVGNARPLFASLAHDLEEIERAQFGSEGARSGHPWAWLQAATVRAKQAKGLALGILRATNALYESLTGGSGRVREIGTDHLRFGTSDPKATLHQRGTVKMPARPVIDFTETDKVAMTKKVQSYIVDGIVFP